MRKEPLRFDALELFRNRDRSAAKRFLYGKMSERVRFRSAIR